MDFDERQVDPCTPLVYCADCQAAEEPEREPTPQPKLKDDETIINPFYMRQLLQYAYRTAREGHELSDAEQMEEAVVCCVKFIYFTRLMLRFLAARARTQIHRVIRPESSYKATYEMWS